MARFESNPDGIRRIGAAVARATADAANDVARSHSGESERDVRAALKAAMAKRGYGEFEPPDDMVRQIASGEPPEFRA